MTIYGVSQRARLQSTRFCLAHVLLLCLSAFPALVGAQSTDNVRLLISPEGVAEIISSPDIVVLDVRKPEFYHAGHVPGAVNLPVGQTFNQSGRTDRVGGPMYIQRLFSQSGVSNKTRVIVYDDGSFIDAGRVFWVLEVYGHHRVQLMDGGMTAWSNKGLPVSFDTVQPNSGNFIAVSQPEKLVTKLSMRLATRNDNVIILDARSQDEYVGNESITDRFGHIPQAINIPWDKNFVDDNNAPHLVTVPELQELYGALDKTKKVVTYCNKGKQSSFTYFVLREMGYDVAHYDGSWFEWSKDANLPVITP